MIAGEDFCWKTAMRPTGRDEKGAPRDSFLRSQTDPLEDGRTVTTISCKCTRRVEIHNRNEAPMIEKEQPRCMYAGKRIAYERCPAWVSKVYEGKMGIDPRDRHRLHYMGGHHEDEDREPTRLDPDTLFGATGRKRG